MKKLLAISLSLAMLMTATVFTLPVHAAEDEEATIEVWIAQADWADAWDEMAEKFMEDRKAKEENICTYSIVEA